MYGTRSFEPKLFKVISQDFPLLTYLSINNDKRQKKKQYSPTLTTFSHLIVLNLQMAHVDYAEQFLFEKNTYLPRLFDLKIEHKSIVTVTNNFTNDEARLNCAKLKSLDIKDPFVRPENFHQFFPLL
jgi:hypothetical protein